jgi:DNA-binding MarR family transcriptional regulator
MPNDSTIPHRVQRNIAFALLAKFTQDKSHAETLGKHLQPLPLNIKDYFSEQIMQYDVNADLTKLADSTTAEARFTLHSASEALQPQPPIDWIVESLFAQGTVSMIVGNPGCKKTYSMIDLAVCAAMGKPWLGFETKKVPVLLIDEESGVRRINSRLGDTMRGHGAAEDIPLKYTALARFNLRSQTGENARPSDLHILEEKIVDTKAKLVIIDALADIMPGGDENLVKDIQPVFMGLRQVADNTQSAMIVIHHANKSGDYRGSSAILGALDVMVTVESKPGSPNVDFEVTKHRDGTPGQFAAVANFSDDQFSLTASQVVKRQKLGEPFLYVLRYLMTNGNSLMKDIIARADTCSEPSAKKAIYDLAKLGLISRTDDGSSGKKATYGLTEQGKSKIDIVM